MFDARTMSRDDEAILSKGPGHYEQSVIDAWVLDGAADRVARYAKQIADPNFIVLVAVANDEVLGFASSIPTKEKLSAIYVKPNKIGHIGRSLLAELEARTFQTAARLTVLASYSGVPFYLENGYTDDGPVSHLDETGQDVQCRNMKKLRDTNKHEG